jgi:hypothetical protein
VPPDQGYYHVLLDLDFVAIEPLAVSAKRLAPSPAGAWVVQYDVNNVEVQSHMGELAGVVWSIQRTSQPRPDDPQTPGVVTPRGTSASFQNVAVVAEADGRLNYHPTIHAVLPARGPNGPVMVSRTIDLPVPTATITVLEAPQAATGHVDHGAIVWPVRCLAVAANFADAANLTYRWTQGGNQLAVGAQAELAFDLRVVPPAIQPGTIPLNTPRSVEVDVTIADERGVERATSHVALALPTPQAMIVSQPVAPIPNTMNHRFTAAVATSGLYGALRYQWSVSPGPGWAVSNMSNSHAPTLTFDFGPAPGTLPMSMGGLLGPAGILVEVLVTDAVGQVAYATDDPTPHLGFGTIKDIDTLNARAIDTIAMINGLTSPPLPIPGGPPPIAVDMTDAVLMRAATLYLQTAATVAPGGMPLKEFVQETSKEMAAYPEVGAYLLSKAARPG